MKRNLGTISCEKLPGKNELISLRVDGASAACHWVDDVCISTIWRDRLSDCFEMTGNLLPLSILYGSAVSKKVLKRTWSLITQHFHISSWFVGRQNQRLFALPSAFFQSEQE
ncbi:hypothetical protein CEXT_355291 [Caerostris extrusa]|uniref:Uncharacterized protein n=1 Tax=Caerostris extrusa TaxID=172846 RepID=A0AAV4NV53_CAEEX|nr:hypothetical protein CEXT_355291 [Caerostris extrusa]